MKRSTSWCGLEAEVAQKGGGQAEFHYAAEAGGDHGIEEGAGAIVAAAAQEAQIVIGAVEDELFAFPSREERGEGVAGQRIDEEILAGDADLNEAELLEVRMEAIRLGIDGDAPLGLERGEDGGEFVGGADQRGPGRLGKVRG